MKKKNLFLTVLALALVLSATVGSALAYFTANASAKGKVPIKLGGGTHMEEEFEGWTKTVTISYDEGDQEDPNTQPVYVRFRAFGPSFEGAKEVKLNVSGEGWTQAEDGWYYYETPLGPKNLNASPIYVHIEGLDDWGQYDKFLKEGDGLDVVVVYESAPVLYDTDGNPLDPRTPDIWEQKLQHTEDTFKPAESGPEGGE